MELNRIATGIKLVGTTIKEISVENNIVNVQKEAKRSFGLNINEPSFENIDELSLIHISEPTRPY